MYCPDAWGRMVVSHSQAARFIDEKRENNGRAEITRRLDLLPELVPNSEADNFGDNIGDSRLVHGSLSASVRV